MSSGGLRWHRPADLLLAATPPAWFDAAVRERELLLCGALIEARAACGPDGQFRFHSGCPVPAGQPG